MSFDPNSCEHYHIICEKKKWEDNYSGKHRCFRCCIGYCDFFRLNNKYILEFIAEMFGTFLLVVFRSGSIAQFIVQKQVTNNPRLICDFGYSLGLTCAMLFTAGGSPPHLNPALTLGLIFVGRFPAWKILHFLIAQLIGAYGGGAFIFIMFADAVEDFGSRTMTKHQESVQGEIWASEPRYYQSALMIWIDQLVNTTVFIMLMCAILDRRSRFYNLKLIPLYSGIALFTVGVSLGYNQGYPVNPAVDIGPRAFAVSIGYNHIFDVRGGYGYVPVSMCTAGGVIGALLYQILIGNHLPRDCGILVKDKEVQTSKENIHILNQAVTLVHPPPPPCPTPQITAICPPRPCPRPCPPPCPPVIQHCNPCTPGSPKINIQNSATNPGQCQPQCNPPCNSPCRGPKVIKVKKAPRSCPPTPKQRTIRIHKHRPRPSEVMIPMCSNESDSCSCCSDDCSSYPSNVFQIYPEEGGFYGSDGCQFME